MAKDDESGCFEELGRVCSFGASVTVTRTYAWKVGEELPRIDISSYGGSGGRHDLDTGDEGRGVMQKGGMRYPCSELNSRDRVIPYHDGRGYWVDGGLK